MVAWVTRVSERWQSARPRSGDALVPVMESPDLRDGDDPATWRGSDDSWLGTVVLKRLVWPRGVVVGEISAQDAAEPEALAVPGQHRGGALGRRVRLRPGARHPHGWHSTRSRCSSSAGYRRRRSLGRSRLPFGRHRFSSYPRSGSRSSAGAGSGATPAAPASRRSWPAPSASSPSRNSRRRSPDPERRREPGPVSGSARSRPLPATARFTTDSSSASS
jgi:hypothetical protein